MTVLEESPDPAGFATGPEPPHDLEAEQCVLGGMILGPQGITDVTDIITARDFYRPAHETIWNAILDLFAQNKAIDPLTLTAYLRRIGELERVGGPTYLATLVHQVPTASNAAYYAEIVREMAIFRRLDQVGTTLKVSALARRGEAVELADAAQAGLAAAISVREESRASLIGDDYEDFIGGLEALSKGGGQVMGVPTGLADLDALLRGLHAGQMIVVAGRPGLGKSALAQRMAEECSIKQGLPSVYFSAEMSRHDLQLRITASQARVGLHNLRSGNLTDNDWTRIAKATPRITDAPLTIDDSADLTLMQIKAKCRRLQQKTSLSLVVVDYLQLLGAGAGRRPENRQVEVAELSRGLKLLAKELEVPVVVLSQLNRGPEQRQDKKPALSDLRESGAIEQDADVVILLHREDAYDKESPRAGEADLIVAKHRNGATSTITVASQLHYCVFVDMAPD